ncbi:hypothetical protein [Chryseobacterium culicis]|uniref:DUF3592 domain-containing protein n=1 Tax=Chryseobacterium culicis TaxID=680127 RepID=A0A1H6HFT1_CHRCI|nr:hypothetical protein [Chryseobacterium culicis]SEH33972.1 hypothetical protein SAMN05421593_2532 [Chryseobacterium culicis]
MNKKNFFLILILLFIIFLNRNVLIYRPLMGIIPLKQTKGLIIDEKESQRRGFITGAFNYYYEFSVEDKKYSNPSYDDSYKIGDTVLVEYSENFPFINKIKNGE